ncbi:MAG: GntR family transcriptional regulator [Planctomycetes bacterium]|nr:GntR family transcriptional regulator [Planctomycetota bacterium]MCB9910960.1 GntR family transcriptional regulator [Planctomycetota bacterium]MCB9911573.1 GntR family transcriptional regulator [Planctomycetota bacterium]
MLTVRLDSEEPLADQILRGIRSAIASGELPPGAELPPVRQLAVDLGVNLNTVARVYRVLQTSGLVHTARGRGTRVTNNREVPATDRNEALERMTQQAEALLADAKLAGMRRAQVERLWERACQTIWPTA